MDIQNRKELRQTAKARLENSQNAVKIALTYAAVIVGASLLTNLIQLLLDGQISQAGGLSNRGLRSMLSTIQTMLPMILNFLLMCLGLGFTGAMLRISRGQFSSLNSLRIGFERFWVLLRATLLQGGLYVLAAMASYMISIQIFFLTPMSRGLLSAMAPALQGGTADVMALLENPAIVGQMMNSLIPLYIIMMVIFLAVAAPIYYRYVLVPYLLIDRPGMGALMAMHDSRMMMKKKAMLFFKLDLSLWPYYAASFLSLLMGFGTSILALMGVETSMSPMVLSMIFFGISLVITFLTTLFLQPHLEITHALAYESLLPKQQPGGGVVLGNIFDLAKDQLDQQ